MPLTLGWREIALRLALSGLDRCERGQTTRGAAHYFAGVSGRIVAMTLWFGTVIGQCFGSGQMVLGLGALALGHGRFVGPEGTGTKDESGAHGQSGAGYRC